MKKGKKLAIIISVAVLATAATAVTVALAAGGSDIITPCLADCRDDACIHEPLRKSPDTCR